MKNWYNITDKQRIERWENVLRVLRELTPHERRKHWNMARWGITTECGTVACAAGHCGLDPWFRRRGLQLLPSHGPLGGFKGFENEGELPSGAIATKAFFGSYGSRRIFWNDTPRPVGQVIKEVREYIKELKAEGDTP